MKKLIEGLFGKSWRTAFTGWIKGLLVIAGDFGDAYQNGKFEGRHGIGLAFAILIIISGYVQKDAKVSGLSNTKKEE